MDVGVEMVYEVDGLRECGVSCEIGWSPCGWFTHVPQVRLGNSQRKFGPKLATDTLRFPEFSLPGSALVFAGATGTNGTGGPR